MNPYISAARCNPADDALEILSFFLRQHANKVRVFVNDDNKWADDALGIRSVVALDVSTLRLLKLLGTPLHVLCGDRIDGEAAGEGCGVFAPSATARRWQSCFADDKRMTDRFGSAIDKGDESVPSPPRQRQG